jgi:hypothetical protein
LNSGDPNYAHYAGPLHVKVETNAPPSLAYQRVSGVLDVLQQLLQPVSILDLQIAHGYYVSLYFQFEAN